MIKIERNINAAAITTFGIKANVAVLAQYDNTEDLLGILSDDTLPRPFKHIGAGSNLLFEGDFDGTLIHCSNRSAYFREPENDEVIVTASAGFIMDKLCLVAASKGYWGLENLSGIPGEVGASAVQNVGAYGVEAGDLIVMVKAIDMSTLEERLFSAHEMEFGYRDSIFKQPENRGRYLITEVTFKLSTLPAPNLGYANLQAEVDELSGTGGITPMIIREAVIKTRDSKLPNPTEIGSAGSFFKNPVVDKSIFDNISRKYPDVTVPHYPSGEGKIKIPAAWLIDQSRFKGKTLGGAAVWQKQPLVLVNLTGNATSADVLGLEKDIIDTVSERYGISLSPEVEHIGGKKLDL